MQNINLHIMRASGRLEPYLDTIQEIQKDYLPPLCDTLGISNVDIILCDDPASAIPEVGIGGWTYPSSHVVTISIDPNFQNLNSHLAKGLKSTLAHELNHATRWRRIGYTYNLLESIISEGLADNFDVAYNNSQPPPWSVALNEQELGKYLTLVKPKWNDETYNHAEWFFGAGTIPRWTGYSLGYKLVGDYIKKTGETDHKALGGLPAEAFVE